MATALFRHGHPRDGRTRCGQLSILPLLLDNEVSVTRMAAQVVSGIGFSAPA
ncbi:hypothetical protein P4112_16335 [Pseudomonas aeruginosa]|nr:hypothetical protein [Pseudomonas aeruginosa]